MAHAQQQILDALQTLLAAGVTTAGSRVFTDRVDPLQAGELPAILIKESDQGEEGEEIMLAGHQKRTLAVEILCVLAATETAAADTRNFGLAVEKLVFGSAAMKALCALGFHLVRSRILIDGDGDRLLACRVQSWHFSYFLSPISPDVINPTT